MKLITAIVRPEKLNDVLEALFRAEAVQLAERAAALNRRQSPAILDTLATAYAAAGQFDQAVRTAEEALGLTQAAHSEGLAASIRERLELFRRSKPYRENGGSTTGSGHGR